MTYDPRQSDNPYMGIDDDGYDTSSHDAASSTVEPMTTRIGRGRASARTSNAPTQDGQIPATIRRASSAPKRGIAPQPAPPRRSWSGAGQAPVPSPAQHAYGGPAASTSRSQGKSGRALTSFAAFALYLVALIARLFAIILAMVMITSAFSLTVGPVRLAIVNAFHLTPLLVPSSLLGQFVLETPFGGLLRGDLAIVSIILFCADWLCVTFSTSLRNGRERGA